MEMYGNIKCVTYTELVTEGKILSPSNYKKLARIGKINVVSRGCRNCPALIEYDTLPNNIKKDFNEKHSNAMDELRKKISQFSMLPDIEARNFYATYQIEPGRTLPLDKQKEYTINATVLNEMIRRYNSTSAMHAKLKGTKKGLAWEITVKLCETLREDYGHTLPQNAARLRAKFDEYKKEGYKCLISGKFGNTANQKITPEAGEYLIALKRCKTPVMTNDQIFNRFNKDAVGMGFTRLKCAKTVVDYLNRPDIMPRWFDAVYGEQKSRMRFQRKNMTILPCMPNALWYSDGTKLNLYYKDYVGGKLVVKTTSVYEVCDAYSEVLLGYYISDTENYIAQYNAFRMAIQTAKCKPFEVVNDNQGGNKKLSAGDFFKKMCIYDRRTAPYNGSSKTIESIFGRFQAQVLHKEWYFTGMNVTTKLDYSHPDVEFISANRENLPTLEELKQVYADARKEWNNMPHPNTGIPRIEMYRNGKNPLAQPVGELDMIDMFWVTSSRESTFTSAGISITVDGNKCTYEPLTADGLPDYEFRAKYTGAKFFIQYDPCDMSLVRLLKKDHNGLNFITEAQTYVQMHRAAQEQEHEEMSFYRKVDHLNKIERVKRVSEGNAIASKFGLSPEQNGLNSPKLKGLNLGKHEESIVGEIVTVELGEVTKHTSNIVNDIDLDKL